ncbi:hypothetical protein N7528_003391 [Penicillium herquei]|nr:hypothetical protein N7528_003391 [Penicillium herquei]
MALSGDTDEVQDENLLAASVILRFYEELDVPLVGADDETYLQGTVFFLAAQANEALKNRGLRNAAFWVGMRQKVHTAFITQSSIRLDFSCFDGSIYKTMESTDDSTWANRIVLLCAEVLSFCYGENGHSLNHYIELLEFSEDWYRYKPPSFSPIYHQAPDSSKQEVFPQIWFMGDCHVIAIQHWHLARILLAAFDPRVPRMGPNQKKAAATIEAEIKHHVFNLCGIGFSNKAAPGPITACMGVSMCGDRVTDKFEQAALLDVLIKTEELQALSTQKAQYQLREAWNYQETEHPSPH